ncbi:MAG: glycosyltransferase [bacterium]|nr:glycosyltransferase [bacterium]
MTDRPLISLAVIVRNEAANLPRLLGAHRGLYDEAVVVDTGSTDASVRVAASLGARVATVAWRDDFSAARNEALARCRGKWVLVLDADEHIALADQAVLRTVVAGSAPAGIILPQWNYADEPTLPGWRPLTPATAGEAAGAAGFIIAHQVRLFPAGPQARYEGRIHETVEPSLLIQGLSLTTVEIPVHHHGHRDQGSVQQARLLRNSRLLRLKLADDPHDPRARYELAEQLVSERQPELARRLLECLVAEAPGGPRAADAHRLLGRLELAAGRRASAREHGAAAVTARPDQTDGWVDLIRVRWLTGDQAGAREALAQWSRLFPLDPRLPALTAQVQVPAADNGKQEAACS